MGNKRAHLGGGDKGERVRSVERSAETRLEAGTSTARARWTRCSRRSESRERRVSLVPPRRSPLHSLEPSTATAATSIMAEANWRQNLQGCASLSPLLLLLPLLVAPPPLAPPSLCTDAQSDSIERVLKQSAGPRASPTTRSRPRSSPPSPASPRPSPAASLSAQTSAPTRRKRASSFSALSASVEHGSPSPPAQVLCPVALGALPRLPPLHCRRRSLLRRLVLHRPPHARHQASQVRRASSSSSRSALSTNRD